MSSIVEVLQNKISVLEDEREELEDSLNRVNIKLETYEELLSEENGEEPIAAPKSKRSAGRPKGSKGKKSSKKKKVPNVPKDDLWKQAVSSLPEGSKGTTKEEQERAINRFSPIARPAANYGVKAGKPEDVLGPQDNSKSTIKIKVED